MSETIMIVLGAFGLLAAGTGLGYWLAQLRARSDSARADDIQRQFDDYRQQVTQHFGRTADHFKAIGREYRELYEHMASGADALCDHESLDAKLSFAPKAILESIAGEQEESPAPRDLARAERPVAGAPVETEPRGDDEAKDEAPQEAQADPEAPAEVGAGRTLH